MPNFRSILYKILLFFGTRPSTQLTFLGVLLGILFGYIAQIVSPVRDFITFIGFPGALFVNALKLLIIPLISIIMIRVPSDVGEISKAKKIGFKVTIYYLSTSFLASLIGLAFFNIIRPGTRFNDVCASKPPSINLPNEKQRTVLESITKMGLDAIPPNLFVAFNKNNIFGILFFFLAMGFVLLAYKDTEEGVRFKKLLDLIYQIFMDLLKIVIFFTPIGVFSLIAVEISKLTNFCIFLNLGVYIATFLSAIVFLVFAVYPFLYLIFARKNPFLLMRHFIQACLTAFATASSAAALPLTLEGAESAKLDKEISSFVLPLGATVNMDGSCIYYPITVLFLCALNDISVPISTQILIAIISSIVTIGGAPIPSGALVFLVLVLNAAGLPIVPQISYIWAIDWFMDRTLTTNNIIGDSVGAGIIHEIFLRNKSKYTDDIKSESKIIKKSISNSALSVASRLLDKSEEETKAKKKNKSVDLENQKN